MTWNTRDDLISMKIGTIPFMVLVHGSDKHRLLPGKWVRIKESEGDRWHEVLITNVNAAGDIFASR